MIHSELVERALEMARSAGRTPEPGSHDWWVSRWKELAHMTNGLTTDDPRLGPVLSAMATCQHCYQAADPDGFQLAAAQVQRLMGFVPGAQITWQVIEDRLVTLGPATVELVHHNDDRLYVFVVWNGVERWVSESIITKIEGPKS
jgi:hypothetical protein